MKLGRRYRHRRRELISAVLRSGVLPLLRVPKWQKELPEARERLLEQHYKELGRRLKTLFEELGPTYVKLGQMLSTRRDVLPVPVAQALEHLQDDVAPEPFDRVRETIEEAFHQPLEAVFSEFQTEPVASASIAQAYRARLRTGEEVCVKVQRSGIAEHIRLDLQVIQRAAKRYGHWFRITHVVELEEVIAAFSEQMRFELDFQIEASNLETFAGYHRADKYVRAPKCYHAWTTTRVMTMEYIDATPLKAVNKRFSAEERTEIARRILYSYANQVYRDGFFHGDPHPGNIMVSDDLHIIFLDFGIIGRLSKKNKYAVLLLFLGITRDSPRIIIDALLQMHLLQGTASFPALERDIQALLDKYLNLTLHEVKLSELTSEFLTLLYSHNIRVPGSMTILAKTFVIMEGVVENLGLSQNILEIAEPIARKLLRHFISRDYVTEFFLPPVYDGLALLRELPGTALDFLRKWRAEGYRLQESWEESPPQRRVAQHRAKGLSLAVVLLADALVFAAFFLTAAFSTRPEWVSAARVGAWGAGLFGVAGLVVFLRSWLRGDGRRAAERGQ